MVSGWFIPYSKYKMLFLFYLTSSNVSRAKQTFLMMNSQKDKPFVQPCTC